MSPHKQAEQAHSLDPRDAINGLVSQALQEEVDDDNDAERDAFLAGQSTLGIQGQNDDSGALADAMDVDPLPDSPTHTVPSELLADVSKRVAEGTAASYVGLITHHVKWLLQKKYIKDPHEYFNREAHRDTPKWTALWIHESCDTVDLHGNVITHRKPFTYAHAQKMRAAVTWHFGTRLGLGTAAWRERQDGRMTGNPSTSDFLASFMVSLRRRKTQAGEEAIASRAVTENILKRLFEYNHDEGRCDVSAPRVSKQQGGSWCSARTRIQLQAIYTIALFCFLRIDEALQIRNSDLQLVDKDGNVISDTDANLADVYGFELKLSFRKTSPFGGIKPFVLYKLQPYEAHLDAFSCLFLWLQVSRIEKDDAFIFPKLNRQGCVVEKEHMTQSKFLELFRNNLVDIQIDPAPYGGHSFRRGGVQYFLRAKRSSFREICEWGGWSRDWNTSSILRYIISVSDDAQLDHRMFLNPWREPGIKCPACGRSCHCGR